MTRSAPAQHSRVAEGPRSAAWLCLPALGARWRHPLWFTRERNRTTQHLLSLSRLAADQVLSVCMLPATGERVSQPHEAFTLALSMRGVRRGVPGVFCPLPPAASSPPSPPFSVPSPPGRWRWISSASTSHCFGQEEGWEDMGRGGVFCAWLCLPVRATAPAGLLCPIATASPYHSAPGCRQLPLWLAPPPSTPPLASAQHTSLCTFSTVVPASCGDHDLGIRLPPAPCSQALPVGFPRCEAPHVREDAPGRQQSARQ